MTMQLHSLALTWRTSRAKDSYGLPVVTLHDMVTGARFTASGAGIDLVGLALASWIENTPEVSALLWDYCASGGYIPTYLRLRADCSIDIDGGVGASWLLSDLLERRLNLDTRRVSGPPPRCATIWVFDREYPIKDPVTTNNRR